MVTRGDVDSSATPNTFLSTMSKKRTTAESNNDEQTNKGSESLFQREDDAKRAKLDSLSDTMLQDLPIELLECIFVKVVAMEVKGLKLAKSVWEEKADLVINRLKSVCLSWSSILTTNSFRTKLHRILDGTAKETIRLEVLHEFPIPLGLCTMTTMKDEIFMLYRLNGLQDYAINVYDRNNMAVAKDVIPLLGTRPVSMTACNVSNCVYVGIDNKICLCLLVLRISKDAEHQFNISPWIKDHKRCISGIAVSANGSLIIFSLQHGWDPSAAVSIYDANGSLQHEIMLSPDIDAFRCKNVIQNSNGNLVLACAGEQDYQIKLLEIDMDGSVVRQYQSSLSEQSFVIVADIYGRILITCRFTGVNGMELLDSELNLLGTYSLQQDKDKNILPSGLHYDSERNEIVRIHYDWNAITNGLTIFRFTEE